MIEKYFIAVVPPEPLLTEIQNIKMDIFEAYQTKGALRSPGHITLHMPFSFNGENEEKLISCLEEFNFNQAFDVNLNGYACFEPRVIYLNVDVNEALFNLQKQLVQHVKRNLNLFNQSDDKRGFHPHVTIAFRDLKKANFYTIWEAFQHQSFNRTFNCHSFYLLKHEVGKWTLYKEFLFKG